MILLSADDVSFGFPGHDLFEHVTMTVQEGERIALVAPNGAGKTTLLRILRGRVEPDEGRVATAKDVTIGMLDQERELAEAATVGQALALPFARQLERSQDAVTLAEKVAQGDRQAWHDYARVLGELELDDGFSVGHRIAALGEDVGFFEADFPRTLGTLSGGERRRLALAQLLLRAPSVMLLDEPTNHLDIRQMERLEERLRTYKGGIVIVSHDRTFLSRMATRVDELTDRGITSYPHGFDRYGEERRVRLEHEWKAYDLQCAEIQRQEEFIRKNFAAQKAKQAKSRERALLRISKLERPRDIWGPPAARKLRFPEAARPGRVLLSVENLGWGPPGRVLHRGLSFNLQAGERLGVIGPNGTGKSTLLWAIASAFDRRVADSGRVAIVEGEARLGYNVAAGYTDQTLADLDPAKTLIESVREIRGELPDDAAREYLGKFQFHDEHTGREIASLSGGEKARLALARLLLMPRNLLLLDEPTNHLDIPSREILESALVEFPGAALLVSHDRTFLERTTTRILHIDRESLDLQWGGYAEFVERRQRAAAPAPAARRPSVTPSTAPPRTRPGGAARPEQKTKNEERKTENVPPPPAASDHAARKAEQRERERLTRRHRTAEEAIRKLEEDLRAVEKQMATLSSSDWQKLVDLEQWRGRTRAEIERQTQEWIESGEALERMGG
ncbi:MAG: ABC-F family ATP-binding cassette domain-containing protein [Deltaproteobacteria bacterium]|nr:ABC-F family ATP-binding cassette domain-containing protein [Deltaproteobacteria bacterium]